MLSSVTVQDAYNDLIRRECQASLWAWCTEVLRGYGQKPALHHQLLIEELEAVANGTVDRLMVFMPPRHAKSWYVSRLFPAWFLGNHPTASIIAASHTYDLAEEFGRYVRNLVTQYRHLLGYALRPDSTAAGRWNTSQGGGYLAAGAGKAIAGRACDLAIIDDPVANREDAESDTVRNKTWAWYRSDLYTRLQPGGRIVLLMTRWHEDDLAGRLLNEMETGGDQWRIVRLPALAEENDALGRDPGEALWPQWYPPDALARIRATIGDRDWTALYQQRPAPPEGAIFKIGMLAVHDAEPPCTPVVRSWDLASTEKKMGDWTVGLKLGRTQLGQYCILDVVRFRGGPDEVMAAIVNTAKHDGHMCRVRIPEDPGQAGKQQALHLTRQLAGFIVDAESESGDKGSRAMPFASQVNIGNVSMVKGAWNGPLRAEFASFPSGTHDDQVDAASGAFGIIGLSRPGLRISEAALTRFTGPLR